MTQEHEGRATLRREASAEILLERADASASVGDMTRAEQYYVAALAAGGGEKTIVERLLRVCVADRRYPVAAEYAERYLHRHPQDLDIKFAAASIHAALGQHDRAILLLESIVEKRQRWSEAHYALASVLRDRGQAVATADFHDLQYLKLSPNGPLAETARARLSRAAP